jgi:redox-sensitive bicupin YhaK (pirin superfamily)
MRHLNQRLNSKFYSMNQVIKQITPVKMLPNRMGFSSVDLFNNEFNFEPFLVFTEFHMDQPIFGPHPHAGMSVMTYMLPDSAGSFLNRDSLGDHSIIEPGGMHVTQAGSGIKHDETPTINGIDCHGFQIWINHANENRLVKPKAFHASAKDIPEFKNDTSLVRVLQGVFETVKAPFDLVTSIKLFHITLQPNSSILLDTFEMSFIYLMHGKLVFEDTTCNSLSLIQFEKKGQQLLIKSGDTVSEFMFASGQPHQEPIIYGGPFVMSTEAQLRDTHLRLARGDMGELN